MSVINYSISIWRTTNSTHIARVQKLLNYAAKVALGGAAKSEHVTPFLKELRWLKINEIYKHEIATTIYSLINKKTSCLVVPTPHSKRHVCP